MVLAYLVSNDLEAREILVKRVLGWLGLACLTFVWVQTTAVALRVHSMMSNYDGTHGNASDQWYGRQPQAAEFAQLRTSLEGILDSSFWAGLLFVAPATLLLWLVSWNGCCRWALRDRLAARRMTVLLAVAVVSAQTVMLADHIQAFAAITD